jgi:hypothetical protein
MLRPEALRAQVEQIRTALRAARGRVVPAIRRAARVREAARAEEASRAAPGVERVQVAARARAVLQEQAPMQEVREVGARRYRSSSSAT